MAYSDSIKIKAYALVIQGTTYEETARVISREFGVKITPNTIKNWAEKKDVHGRSWLDYRNETRAVAMQTVEAREKNRILTIRDKAEILTEKIYDQLTGKAAPKISSMDGGSYAFKSLSEFMLKLDQKSQENVSIVMVVQLMLEIFAKVPDVKKAIQKHWQKIEKEISVRILHENPDDVDAKKMIGD